jgi:hypothetical protein
VILERADPGSLQGHVRINKSYSREQSQTIEKIDSGMVDFFA